MSQIAHLRYEVVSDQTAYDALWFDHTKGLPDYPVQPVVDFEQYEVIGVFLGRIRGPASIFVTNAEDTNGMPVVVNISVSVRGEDCRTSTSYIPTPYQIVSVPRLGNLVTFTTLVKPVSCSG